MLQSKTYKKLLTALALAALSHWPGLPAAQASIPALPVLNWQKGSDWINVKTDVSPAAFGDGVHDDTAAIQAGLNSLVRTSYVRKTLYLPAGTYRISKTLVLSKIYGAQIIGQGRSTRITWNGPLNTMMFWSNGAPYCNYRGIIWDGANRASVGVDHQSKTLYEACIRHQDEAFINFTDSGIRVGFHQVVTTSEVTYQNCLFQNCRNGVSFLSANNYNNSFSGCEFQDNGIGINCVVGNAYVRDCHFERSRTVDVLLSSNTHSIRRCTSVGSKQFIFVPGAGSGCGLTVQDCHVDGWTSIYGAVQLGMRGPDTIFDCSFTHPPDSKPPVRLANSKTFTQLAIFSNNTAPSSMAIADQGQNGQTSQLPAGARGPSLSDPKKSFLISTATVPTSLLDVKTLFGAKGNGVTDDTVAITNALNAARQKGGNVAVYLPVGLYAVSKPLPITGGGYSVEGAGCQSAIKWIGPHSGAVFNVHDPQGIAMKNLQILTPIDVAAIQQTGGDTTASQMNYQRIWVGGTLLGPGDTGGVYGHVTKAQVYRGLECSGLSSTTTILMDDVFGSTHFTDCSRAVILGNFMQGGLMQIDGAKFEKTGFFGVLSHNAALNLCDVVVRDNQDFVGTNFYTEQTQKALLVSGDGAMLGQPGHVTIQGSKTQTYDPTAITVNDYEGRVAYAGAGGFISTTEPLVLEMGTRPVDIVLMGNAMGGVSPTFSLGSSATLTSIENCLIGSDWAHMYGLPNALPGISPAVSYSLLTYAITQNRASQSPLMPAVAALDDFRLLGAADLAINFP